MRLHRGPHKELEAEADAILREHLSKITRSEDKSDILTPWKEQDRRKHEIYVPDGVPDAANRKGVFHRVLNTTKPHLNSATPGSLAQRSGALKRPGA